MKILFTLGYFLENKKIYNDLIRKNEIIKYSNNVIKLKILLVITTATLTTIIIIIIIIISVTSITVT